MGRHIAEDCFTQNKDFLACKAEDKNPSIAYFYFLKLDFFGWFTISAAKAMCVLVVMSDL